MRIAIVSDIHGNLTALEAVVADLRQTSPDLVVHGGDLADGGSSPVEVTDRIRGLGWAGVMGNTDEMLTAPESLAEFAAKAPQLHALFAMVGEMADWARAALGEDRLQWLRGLSREYRRGPMALVHGSPETAWRAPAPEAGDAELESIFGPLDSPVVVYGHIHRPFIRRLPARIVANSGSTGLPYDGDPRASYLLVDDGIPSIRRAEYDVEQEVKALLSSGIPHAEWVAKMLRSGSFQMP
jgi:putative phosphoesterase